MGTCSYLGFSGPGGGVAFSVIHDGAIRADHALHCSPLVARSTRCGALDGNITKGKANEGEESKL